MSNLTSFEHESFHDMTAMLLENSPNLIVYLDSENSIVLMSKLALSYLGFESLDSVRGKNIYNVIDKPVLLLLLKKWLEKLSFGEKVKEEFPLERKDLGRYQWFSVQAHVVSTPGNIGGKLFEISDISDSIAQKKIMDSLLVSLPGDILVFDRNLHIILISEAIARENGFYYWREAVGTSIQDLKKLDGLPLISMVDEIILGEESIQETVKVAQGNSDIKWYSIDLRPIQSIAGVLGYILTRFEITQEIKPRAILESIMDSVTDAITIINPQGIVEYASRSLTEPLGYPVWKSLVGQPWKHIFRYNEQAGEKQAEIFNGDWNAPRTGTLTLDSSEGRAYFNYRVNPLNYKDERFGLIAISTNTTELVAERTKAESAARAKSAFLANMSHELRTPMNAVLGMNELLGRTSVTPQQKNYISQIRSSATMLLSIINDILDFSKIEDRKMELSIAPYQVLQLLQDVINLVLIKAVEKELSFSVDIDPQTPAVASGDLIRVKQILINLLNNAVKFTKSGEIILSVSPSLLSRYSVALKFEIKDTGVGIPLEKQSELFERFSRIESTGSSSIEGSGLGLSICKGLITLMGGSLTVDSKPGKGSTFTAVINQQLVAPVAPIVRFSTKNSSILIFENDSGALSSIRKMASYAACHSDICTSFEKFQEHLSSPVIPWTHIIFEYRSAYQFCTEAVQRFPNVKWLGLLSMTDFVGNGKHPDIDFIFKPLIISTFAKFLNGERVDFSNSLPMGGSFGESQDFTYAANSRILIVDDNTVNRKVAEGFLSTLDIKTEEASSGEKAVELAKKNTYDLILMDHIMSGMDGIEATKKIRLIKGYQHTPIIALTANVSEDSRNAFFAAGMTDVLHKPLELQVFLNCIKKWLPKSKIETASGWIEGLDKEAGIKYTGSEKNLEKILNVFSRTAPKLLEQLSSGSHSPEISQFRTATHSLVSSLANIGAVSLSDLAKSLEQAIISGDAQKMDSLYPDLHAGLEKLMKDVKIFQEKENA